MVQEGPKISNMTIKRQLNSSPKMGKNSILLNHFYIWIDIDWYKKRFIIPNMFWHCINYIVTHKHTYNSPTYFHPSFGNSLSLHSVVTHTRHLQVLLTQILQWSSHFQHNITFSAASNRSNNHFHSLTYFLPLSRIKYYEPIPH